jgi:hypothetical protein
MHGLEPVYGCRGNRAPYHVARLARRPRTRAPHRSRCPPNSRCRPWNGLGAARTWWSAGPPAPARRSSSKPSGRKSSKQVCRWRGSPSNRSGCSCALTVPTIPWARPWPRSCALSSSSSTMSGFFRRRGCRRKAHPHRRSGLRTQIRGDLLEPAPQRLRRAHAQNTGHRHRRPAPAPRTPVPKQRRLRAPDPSPPRERSQTPDLTHPSHQRRTSPSRADSCPPLGSSYWPPTGNPHVRPRAVPAVH